ncbi:hypothetical protein F4803DRAFT_554847 [Xylaria telfairii]|nr:hypothetical protein F4803DRAFT_554847 [Xylaria telfairii]
MTQSIPGSERVVVRIPDMFVSFPVDPPRLNPNYSEVKTKLEAWISRYAAPEAPILEYRTVCDWGKWYMKEERELVPHNIVAAARMSGLGAQDAFDRAGTCWIAGASDGRRRLVQCRNGTKASTSTSRSISGALQTSFAQIYIGASGRRDI